MSNPIIKLSDYQPPAWLISQVELTFVINENRTEVASQLHLKKNGDTQQVELDGEGLETLDVRIGDQAVDYQIQDGVSVLPHRMIRLFCPHGLRLCLRKIPSSRGSINLKICTVPSVKQRAFVA